MTDRDAIIRDLIAKVDAARDHIRRIEESIAHRQRFNHGLGCADDRVGLYYAECALEGFQRDLGDELYDEARLMDLGWAA